MRQFLQNLVVFIKEILLFGLDAFMVSAAKEIAKRFWNRLKERGGTAGFLEGPDDRERSRTVRSGSEQSALPFLDEYRD